MIYLASPYSHENPQVREHRFIDVMHATAKLLERGHHVVSPILHGHPLAKYCSFKTDFAFWQKYCEEWINDCKVVFVLKLEGWRESVGVTAEIQYAMRMGYQVFYLNPTTLELESAEA